MSALQTLISLNEERKYVLNIRDKIRKSNIKIYWTKVHVNNPGNDRADELAKLATSKCIIDVFFHPNKIQIKKVLIEKYIDWWQERWDNNTEGREVCDFIKR